MKREILLIIFLIAVTSIILYTSTDTVSLFSGQHTFTAISDSGNQIDCTACHSRINSEISNSSIHDDLSCEACHRYNGTGITFASGDTAGSTPGNESHAAYTPRCLDCHGGSGTWIENTTGSLVFAPPAKAFNESGYGSDYSAHKRFVLDANTSDASPGENEACLACHTNYTISLSYSYFWNIDYTLSSWSFTSFSYNGTRNYDIQWSKSGAKHEFVSLNSIDCTECHKNIYDALVNGTDGGSNEDYLTHAPIEIDASRWDTDNSWEHYRYHYIPASNRATWVNSTYCLKCHNVTEYASEHPSDNTTYSLGNVAADTNSSSVHAAEALTCATCHGSGKTKADGNQEPGNGHSGSSFVDNIASNYARTFNGDICMGCHEAAIHPQSMDCGRCHSSAKGNADVTIESEPSGYCTNN
ncbi:MAG: hypothetical protein ACXQS6_03705 [Candidatus Syntropharchaeales archaeon]